MATLAILIACALVGASSAGAYSFTDPDVRPYGNLVTVVDWSAEQCEDPDIPDTPARAFRDPAGRVNLIASHWVNRSAIGPELDSVIHQCPLVMGSQQNADPAMFSDMEYISAPYMLPDGRAFSLAHMEYRGAWHPGQCPSANFFRCWFNSITLATSTDGGTTFHDAATPPGHLVASTPYRYEPDSGPAGLMQPTNIIRNGADGLYYAMIAAQPYGAQERGVCVMRTGDLSDPSSWRAWDGSSYSVRFINPYLDSSPPEEHVCQVVSFTEIEMMSSSLTYSTYLNKWVLVGASETEFPYGDGPVENPGFYWSTSTDLIHWSMAKQLVSGEVPWSHVCGDDNPILYPSLLDPTSPSRNFETIGRRPFLFFTQMNYGYNSNSCWQAHDRDLMRIGVEFNKPPDCTNVQAKPDVLPSMNRRLFPVTVSGAMEPDSESMTTTILSVTQTQPVKGPGDATAPDAQRTSDPRQVLLRAEYGPSGGRVYRINVKMTDSKGGSCTTTEKVSIPRGAAEPSASYDSFKAR